jgi:hypothetical protein
MRLFTKHYIAWTLGYLLILEEGRYPVEHSSYTSLPGKRKGGTWAYFEGPAGLAALVTRHLDRCGSDGMLVYLCYCFGRDEETVAQMAGVSKDILRHWMNRAIAYVVWCLNEPIRANEEERRPRRISYKTWRNHRF